MHCLENKNFTISQFHNFTISQIHCTPHADTLLYLALTHPPLLL